MGFPNAWSLPQQSQWRPFPLPTLLCPSQPHHSQKRYGPASKLSSRKGGGAETTRSKAASHAPLCIALKRHVTAPLAQHTDGVDSPACQKPSLVSGGFVDGHVWSL